jgi:ABC-type nickel/cobalt efflux system permease component RcnA
MLWSPSRGPRPASALVVLAVVATTNVAFAHPLGNFTVNRYARLEPGTRSLAIVYVVDYAEIPTFQELARFPALAPAKGVQALSREDDTDRLARELAARWRAGLHVTVGGTALDLAEGTHSLELSEGVGALPTMKLHLRLEGVWPHEGAGTVTYEDLNEPNRLGWREIVVQASSDLRIADTIASFSDRTRGLTAYPADPNAEFPQETRAQFAIDGMRAGVAPLDRARNTDAESAIAGHGSVPSDRFAQLITQEQLTPSLVLVALAIAFALGGFHALSPGHGKTIVAAYLIGARGTAKHALVLSAIVTASHTIGVFALGFVTLALSAHVVPERLYPPIQLLSGVTIVSIGITMLVRRLRSGGSAHSHSHERGVHTHDGHAHDHEHDHGHSHAIPEGEPTMASLLALGVSGGILPCPSALVVLLSAIALHRIGFGLVLIVAFSMGLAAVLCAIGILVIRVGSQLSRFEPAATLVRRAPALSALLVTVLGLLLVIRSVSDLGLAVKNSVPDSVRMPVSTAP